MSQVENNLELPRVVAYAIADPPCLEGKTIEGADDTILSWDKSLHIDNYTDVNDARFGGYVYTYLMKTYGPGHFELQEGNVGRVYIQAITKCRNPVKCHQEWLQENPGSPDYQEYEPDKNSEEWKVWDEVEEYIASKVEYPEI